MKEFMAAHPDETFLSAAPKLNLHRKRISKLLTIANQLPSNLITELANCNDPKTLRQMNVKHLFQMSHNLTLRKRNELPTTETELKAIAAPAIIGLKRMPKNG